MVMGLDVSCDGGGYFSPSKRLSAAKRSYSRRSFLLLG